MEQLSKVDAYLSIILRKLVSSWCRQVPPECCSILPLSSDSDSAEQGSCYQSKKRCWSCLKYHLFIYIQEGKSSASSVYCCCLTSFINSPPIILLHSRHHRALDTPYYQNHMNSSGELPVSSKLYELTSPQLFQSIKLLQGMMSLLSKKSLHSWFQQNGGLQIYSHLIIRSFAKTERMRNTLNCNEFSLQANFPQKPVEHNGHSYSRGLYRTPSEPPSIWQTSKELSEQEPSLYHTAWSSALYKRCSRKKDDMLNVLKGRNYVWSTQDKVNQRRDQYKRFLGKNKAKVDGVLTGHTVLSKLSLYDNGRVKGRKLLMRNRENEEVKKKYMNITLRVQKWLDITNIKVW